MQRGFGTVVVAWGMVFATPALAQPADLPVPPSTASSLPAGVEVSELPSSRVYVGRGGRVLYGMDMRTLLRFAPDPALYCTKACANDWEPVLAPKDAAINIRFPAGFGPQQRALPPGFVQPQSAPDWAVIMGADGPQYVYKGWHLVFTRKGAQRDDISFDGAEKFTWNTLKFVPPLPKVVAPPAIGTVLVGQTYAFADKDGRALFTGECLAGCPDWVPLSGGMASRAVGDWTISHGPDGAQWRYRGQPVFVSGVELPAGVQALRP